jgi:hypothetical protein
MQFIKNLFKKTKFSTDANIELEQKKRIESDLDNIIAGKKYKIYPILKPNDWIGLKAGALHQAVKANEDIPELVIGFGYDSPNSFVFLQSEDYTEEDNYQKVINEAYENLSKYEVNQDEVVPNKVILINGLDFCSEKILDQEFMKSLQHHLGGDKLLVSIPRRRCMMVTTINSFAKKDIGEKYMSVHTNVWNDPSYGNAPIINAIFTVDNGDIISVNRLSSLSQEENSTSSAELPSGKNTLGTFEFALKDFKPYQINPFFGILLPGDWIPYESDAFRARTSDGRINLVIQSFEMPCDKDKKIDRAFFEKLKLKTYELLTTEVGYIPYDDIIITDQCIRKSFKVDNEETQYHLTTARKYKDKIILMDFIARVNGEYEAQMPALLQAISTTIISI